MEPSQFFTLHYCSCRHPPYSASAMIPPNRHDNSPNLFSLLPHPPSAWQSQDIAPSNSGISIPTHDAGINNGTLMSADDQSWNSNGASGRSPGRGDRGGEPPRRTRSRSPGGAREGERGSVSFFPVLLAIWAVHATLWEHN